MPAWLNAWLGILNTLILNHGSAAQEGSRSVSSEYVDMKETIRTLRANMSQVGFPTLQIIGWQKRLRIHWPHEALSQLVKLCRTSSLGRETRHLSTSRILSLPLLAQKQDRPVSLATYGTLVRSLATIGDNRAAGPQRWHSFT